MHKIRAGDYGISTWIVDSQVTYRAVRGRTGWVVTKSVAGAERTTTFHQTPTLREAKALVQSDWEFGML